MPLYVHQSGELVRVVPDRPDRAHTEHRRLEADPAWRRIGEAELDAIREGADPADVWEAAPAVPPPPAKRTAKKAAAKAEEA